MLLEPPRAHLGDELVRVRVPVVLSREVGRDGRHGNPDVSVLDAVALRKLVHDRLRLLGQSISRSVGRSVGRSNGVFVGPSLDER